MKTLVFRFEVAGASCNAQEPTWEFSARVTLIGSAPSDTYITTADRVHFIGPLDRAYGNDCEAEKGGDLRFVIDPLDHTVELRVDPPPEPYGCPPSG